MMDAPATMFPGIGADASETADYAATGLAASSPRGKSRIADNEASIDPLLTMPMPPVEEASGNQADAHQATAQSAPADRDISLLVDNAAQKLNLNGRELIGAELNGIGLHESDLNGSRSNGAQMNGSCLNGNSAEGLGTIGHHPDSAILVSDDVMQIIVPGLESPRPLHSDSLVAKRQDLKQRGLLDG